MTLETWFSFVFATTILCFSPGPTVFLVLGQSLSFGKKSVLPLILGVLSGDIIAMSLSILGMGAILATSALLFTTLKYAGAAYLFYLGLKTWRTRSAKNENKPLMKSKNMFKEALMVTALNPKGLIFFMAFFPLFINPQLAYLPQVLMLAVSFLFISSLSASLYALFGGHLRQKIQSSQVQNVFNKVSGSLLIGAAALTANMQKQD